MISYSGIGAHHQNGVAEGSICTITQWAHVMMLHQVIHRPAEARLVLWPFALDHSTYLWNHMMLQQLTHLMPIEIFGTTRFGDYRHLQCSHILGCPTYVLDPMLQDGHKIPKWRPRAWHGLYLGVLPKHSSTQPSH
jgi:hypothetical protein